MLFVISIVFVYLVSMVKRAFFHIALYHLIIMYMHTFHLDHSSPLLYSAIIIDFCYNSKIAVRSGNKSYDRYKG